MIVHLNGWPGAGKLTVGRELARLLNARLVDNHTLHNVALATCDIHSEERWQVYHAVRDIAYARLRELPLDEAIVLTNALTREAPREIEAWATVKKLALDREDSLFAITLDCSLEENLRRVQSEDRVDNRKLASPDQVRQLRTTEASTLQEGEDADYRLVIDNTFLAPDVAAQQIKDFIDTCLA